MLGGAAAGAVIATAVNAGATTTSGTGSAVAGYAPAGYPGSNGTPGGRMSFTTGTVTAVGSNSVTIKTGNGTTTCGVTAASDVDKNGEAQLSDLKVGDEVRFTTTTANGATIIDKLHAGDEAKDRPAAPPSGAPTAGG